MPNKISSRFGKRRTQHVTLLLKLVEMHVHVHRSLFDLRASSLLHVLNKTANIAAMHATYGFARMLQSDSSPLTLSVASPLLLINVFSLTGTTNHGTCIVTHNHTRMRLSLGSCLMLLRCRETGRVELEVWTRGVSRVSLDVCRHHMFR